MGVAASSQSGGVGGVGGGGGGGGGGGVCTSCRRSAGESFTRGIKALTIQEATHPCLLYSLLRRSPSCMHRYATHRAPDGSAWLNMQERDPLLWLCPSSAQAFDRSTINLQPGTRPGACKLRHVTSCSVSSEFETMNAEPRTLWERLSRSKQQPPAAN